jgi:hypothetical protein
LVTRITRSPTKGEPQTFNSGASITTVGEVTPSQYSIAPGTYSVRVDVLDAANNILEHGHLCFHADCASIQGLSAQFYRRGDAAWVNVSRAVVSIAGCGQGDSDLMNGGAGVAAADYDGDGFEDLYVVDMSGLGHLWHSEGDGPFTDQAAVAGIPILVRQSGVSFADIDNDGYPDLLLMPAEAQMVLLHNLGNGTFVDITSTSGMRTPVDQNFVGATWGDYDNDGFLDAYIAVHVDCASLNANDHLFHNNGNLTFTDVTNLLGGPTGVQVNARSLVPIFVDYNADGLIDLTSPTTSGENITRTCCGAMTDRLVPTVGSLPMSQLKPIPMYQCRPWAWASAITPVKGSSISS